MPTLKTVMSVHFFLPQSIAFTIIMPFRPSPVLFLNYPPLNSVTETLGAFAPN